MDNETANLIQGHVGDLEDLLGRPPTSAELVEAARSPDSPLHACLEWDDQKCGEAYRRQQARHLRFAADGCLT